MPAWLNPIQRLRAGRKVQRIAPYFPVPTAGLAVLDLGAGEGFVGEQVQARLGCRVTLADVLPLNQTDLPHVPYDGHTLPFPDAAFDVTILYFVLHHCADPAQVFGEALRVTRRRLIVVESVYEARWDLWLLTTLDQWANRLRSGGLMQPQEEHLHFRTVPAWQTWFAAHGCTLQALRQRGRVIHKQAFFSLDVPDRQKAAQTY